MRFALSSMIVAAVSLFGTGSGGVTPAEAVAQQPCPTCPGGYAGGAYGGPHAAHASYYYGPKRASGQDWAIGHQEVHQYKHPHPVPCFNRQYLNSDLFYNFYVPTYCDSVGAELYMAPYDTPPLVGHTYYTYQPMLPHEHMYQHHRTYRHYYNHNLGMHRTSVVYWSSPVKSLLRKGWRQLGFPPTSR